MSVVVDQFEASADPAGNGPQSAAPPREPYPFETRRRLRAVAIRAARVLPC